MSLHLSNLSLLHDVVELERGSRLANWKLMGLENMEGLNRVGTIWLQRQEKEEEACGKIGSLVEVVLKRPSYM